MATDHRRSLQADATPQCLDAVLDLTRGVARDAGVATADLIRFESAVMEVVGNIVTHGGVAGASRLSVSVSAADGWLRAVVDDDGPQLPLSLETVAMPDEMAESGRGLAMVAGLLDEFRRERRDQGNCWRLGVVLTE